MMVAAEGQVRDTLRLPGFPLSDVKQFTPSTIGQLPDLDAGPPIFLSDDNRWIPFQPLFCLVSE